jgi:ABC-type branched-subunit amino acid transport system ATPase component
VLSAGEKICEGTPTRVAQDPRVVDAYLGTDDTETSEPIALA